MARIQAFLRALAAERDPAFWSAALMVAFVIVFFTMAIVFGQ